MRRFSEDQFFHALRGFGRLQHQKHGFTRRHEALENSHIRLPKPLARRVIYQLWWCSKAMVGLAKQIPEHAVGNHHVPDLPVVRDVVDGLLRPCPATVSLNDLAVNGRTSGKRQVFDALSITAKRFGQAVSQFHSVTVAEHRPTWFLEVVLAGALRP